MKRIAALLLAVILLLAAFAKNPHPTEPSPEATTVPTDNTTGSKTQPTETTPAPEGPVHKPPTVQTL